MSPITYGLAGVGFMGKGILRNLLLKGKQIGLKSIPTYDVDTKNVELMKIALCNEKQENLIYTDKLDSAAHFFYHTDIVGVSLPSEDICRKVLLDKDHGMINNYNEHKYASKLPSKKKYIVDHGTYSRQFSIDMHKEVAELTNNRVVYLDAPVSGGPGGAWDGSLSIMVGGAKEDVDACRSMMGLYSHKIQHMGAVGTGTTAKLINQTLVGVHMQAAAEALYLAEQMGITDFTELKDLLGASWGQSKILDLVLTEYITMKTKVNHDYHGDVVRSSPGVVTSPGGTLTWDKVLRADSSTPLRNIKKDFDCIDSEVRRFDKGRHSTPLLPAMDVARTALTTACSEEKGLKNAGFASLLALIQERNM